MLDPVQKIKNAAGRRGKGVRPKVGKIGISARKKKKG